MLLTIGLIVEGHGEVLAAPVLIRRIAAAFNPSAAINFHVRRIPKSKLLRTGELERSIEALARQIGRDRPILVLVDADEDCPVTLSTQFRERCAIAHSDLRVSTVIANREYEAWFLAGARSICLQICPGVDLQPVANTDNIRGAKERLTSLLQLGHYSETRHQEKFSALLDLDQAAASRSFRKFRQEIRLLLPG